MFSVSFIFLLCCDCDYIIFLCYRHYYSYHFVYDNYYFCFHLYHFVECPNITFNNSWYIISVSGWYWNWNRFTCKSQGGDLISIETEEEWNFINNEIQRQNTTNYDKIWNIGLTQKAGNWTWVNGRPLTICKWGQREPSDQHDAASMRFSNGEWGVFSSVSRTRWEDLHAYICEISKGKLFVWFFFNIILSKLKGIRSA